MVLLNHSTRELTAKVVYYGPGLCGKTSNIQFIYDTLDEGQRGKMLSLATDTDRTLFFDFMPMELGTVKGFKVRVQLYTVPGQVFYAETRKRVLKGADGIVFVADSQKTMRQANMESFSEFKEHLVENGLDPVTIPTVLQYNKRDLKDICSVEEMDSDLNPGNIPFFEAVAKEGVGVEDTLRCISKLVLKKLMGQTLDSPPSRAAAPRLKLQKGATVVMDQRKLLSELGVTHPPARSRPAVAESAPAPAPAPPPPPAAKSEEEVLLGVGENSGSALFGSSDDLLSMGDGGADLLESAEDLPLSFVEATPDSVRLQPVQIVEFPPAPEVELGLLDDPPALHTDSQKIIRAEGVAPGETAPGQAPRDLVLTEGEPLELELRIGDRKVRLTIRLEGM